VAERWELHVRWEVNLRIFQAIVHVEAIRPIGLKPPMENYGTDFNTESAAITALQRLKPLEYEIVMVHSGKWLICRIALLGAQGEVPNTENPVSTMEWKGVKFKTV